MVNNVSSSSAVNQYQFHQVQQAGQQPKSKKTEPHDTVVLSPQAKAAAGDPDHDGD